VNSRTALDVKVSNSGCHDRCDLLNAGTILIDAAATTLSDSQPR